MSILNDSLVTGSADHGLREYNLYKILNFYEIIIFRRTLKYRRELFPKKWGHSEWVTTCAHLSDGRILSGGM